MSFNDKCMFRVISVFLLSLLLISCGGGGGGAAAPATTPTPTNQPPEFGQASYTAGCTIVSLSYSSTIAKDAATDPENDLITYSRNGGTCSWATVSADGTITGAPTLGLGEDRACTVVVQATATGGSDTATVNITVDPDTSQESTVGARYPAVGENWNDYVKASNPLEACDPTLDESCLHAGELRSMVVPDRSSCECLTAEDTLGAFDWVCDDSVDSVRFVSTGLKSAKGLRDVIDFNVTGPFFKPNQLRVLSDGNLIAHNVVDRSSPDYSDWWSNRIVDNSDGRNSFNPSEIHIVSADNHTQFSIDANKVALVTQPNLTITGQLGSGGFQPLVKSMSDYNFLWLEVAVDATQDSTYTDGIQLNSTKHSVLHNTVANNSFQQGVRIDSSSYNRISNVAVSGSITNGIFINNSTNNTIINVDASGNNIDPSYAGLDMQGSNNNNLRNINVNLNKGAGLKITSSSNNVFTNLMATQNSNYGIRSITSVNNTFSGLNVTDNSPVNCFDVPGLDADCNPL